MKTVVFTFGRMNPPTSGHQLLVNKLVSYAKTHSATPRVYLSHSVGKKDPLPYDDKISFARLAFGAIVRKSSSRNLFEILKDLEKEGYKKAIMFAGSDRVSEFKKLLDKYNGKEYNFDEIQVISAGERDPDADDVSGMSASKMRALVKDDQLASFMRGAPSTLTAPQRKNMFNTVRKYMLGEDVMEYGRNESFVTFVIEEAAEEIDISLPSDSEMMKHLEGMDIQDLDLHDEDALMLELITGEEEKEDVQEAKVLSIQQRQKLATRMKGMSKRLARLRQIKAKQMPAQQRLRMRARKAALMILRRRATGKKSLDYAALSKSQRVAVDNALVNRFGKSLNTAVDRISKRILPMIRKKAQTSVAQARDTKESFVYEAKEKEGSAKDVAQDKAQAAKRDMSVADWEKTKADAAHDSPLNIDPTKLNNLGIDPTQNDRVAPNPKQGHLHLNRKLAHYARSVDEGRKSSADKDARDAGDTNIIYQMRKTINSRGEHETTFADGHKTHVSIADAKKLIAKFDALRLPADKHAFTIQAGKSLSGFRDVLAHGVKQDKKKISLGGKKFNEFYLGVGRSRTTSAYDNDEPPGTRRVAEAAKDEDRPEDPNRSRPLPQKLDLLLRLGLVDTDELQKYRRALRSSKKFALQSPELRMKIADLLDKLIDLTTKDPATYSRVRYNVMTKEAMSLLNKAEESGIDVDIIFEVFSRGYSKNEDINEAFNRVNSFIAGGKAAELDDDLVESLDRSFPYTYHGKNDDGFHHYSFTPGKGKSKINVSIMHNPKTKGAGVVFHSGDEEDEGATGEHPKTSAKVFGTVGKIMKDHGAKHSKSIDHFLFSAAKSEPSRVSLYKRIAHRIGGKTADDTSKFQTGFKIPNPSAKLKENIDLPQKYRAGLSDTTAAARKAHWEKMSKYSDRDPRAYQPAPGDATAKTRPSKHTLKYKRMYGEEAMEESSDSGLAAKAKKSGVSLSTLRKVYRRGVAAWNSGHRPGTTPQQWGMARVNSYITKGKGTYHGADKDLREEDVDEACWDTHKQVGMKKKGNRMVPNCVPKEAANPAQQAAIAIAMKKAGKKPQNEETQIDEISSKVYKSAMHKAASKAIWSAGGPGSPRYKKYSDMARKFQKKGIEQEKKEKSKMNESSKSDAQRKAAGAALATQRGEYAGGKKGGAINRMALMKTKDLIKLARKKPVKEEAKSIQTSHPHAIQPKTHTHPTGKVPYGSMTNKELRDALPKKVRAASEGYTGSEPTSSNPSDPSNRFVGTDAIRKNYASMTPGQEQVAGEIGVASFSPEKPSYGSAGVQRTRAEVDQSKEKIGQKNLSDIRKALGGMRESYDLNESFAAGFELAPFARDYGITVNSSFEHHPEVQEALDAQEDAMNEAIYQGRNVPLNKPMKGDVKKSKVYVRDPSTGNVKKVNFGDKKLSIKKDQPARKRSYCARSGGQGNLTKKTSANYWSRRAWNC